jgi:dipeptide/tripeptide permease
LDPNRRVHVPYSSSLDPLDFYARIFHRYILITISKILASIAGLEYAFTKTPKNMRSLVMLIFLFMSAISSAIVEGFVGEFALFSIDPSPH